MQRGICFWPNSVKSRSLVASLLGMTGSGGAPRDDSYAQLPIEHGTESRRASHSADGISMFG